MNKKLQTLTYKCNKCGFEKHFVSNQEINTKCKVCGNEMEFSYAYKYNPNNGLNAIKNSNIKYTTIIQSKPEVTCPYCHSTNTKKISTMSKAGSVALFGIFSQKVKKQWHCNGCGSDF